MSVVIKVGDSAKLEIEQETFKPLLSHFTQTQKMQMQKFINSRTTRENEAFEAHYIHFPFDGVGGGYIIHRK